MAINIDVFLYAGEANPKDVILADPTVKRGEAIVTLILRMLMGIGS